MRTIPESNINPLKVGELLWGVVGPAMKKLGVTFSEIAPMEKVDKPIITWKMVSRNPGVDGNQKFAKPSYLNQYLEEDQTITLVYNQTYDIILEYTLYGPSSTILDNLAWDLELALIAAQGYINQTYPGFSIRFSGQVDDRIHPTRSAEGELRILRFRIILPVEFLRNEQALQGITLRLFQEDSINYEFPAINTSLETHYPDVGAGVKVLSIFAVKRSPLDGEELRQVLVPGYDYTLKWDLETGYYINWMPNGSVPAVDEEFWMTLVLSTGTQSISLR